MALITLPPKPSRASASVLPAQPAPALSRLSGDLDLELVSSGLRDRQLSHPGRGRDVALVECPALAVDGAPQPDVVHGGLDDALGASNRLGELPPGASG